MMKMLLLMILIVVQVECQEWRQEGSRCSTFKHAYCKDGSCTSTYTICNGETGGCDDGSDEVNCEEYTCQPDTTKCADNVTCIQDSYFCDGHNNCPDESDENPKCCEEYTCLPGRAKCPGSDICIQETSLCDGSRNCADGSDEDRQFCKKFTCPSGNVKCGDNVTCIPDYYQCDDFDDCHDGSDEQSCD